MDKNKVETNEWIVSKGIKNKSFICFKSFEDFLNFFEESKQLSYICKKKMFITDNFYGYYEKHI